MNSKESMKKILNLLKRKKEEKNIEFIIALWYLITFILSRSMIYLFGDALPYLFLNIKGVHIHHFAYGFFLLAIAGYLSLVTNLDLKHKKTVAVIYGVGLGLAIDEFGMWLRLEDNYYLRISFDAAIIILALFINFIYFGSNWSKLFSKLKDSMQKLNNMIEYNEKQNNWVN